VNTHVVKSKIKGIQGLIATPAKCLKEQRDENRGTIKERCALVAEKVNSRRDQSLVWCHLNDEGKYLREVLNESIEVKGGDSLDKKEEALLAFANGEIKVLITKPKIGAWGMNFQKCSHMTYFPSHSYEQYYQAIRRSWRFGQKNDVEVDIITSELNERVLQNMVRKQKIADKMFDNLVGYIGMNKNNDKDVEYKNKLELPEWL